MYLKNLLSKVWFLKISKFSIIAQTICFSIFIYLRKIACCQKRYGEIKRNWNRYNICDPQFSTNDLPLTRTEDFYHVKMKLRQLSARASNRARHLISINVAVEIMSGAIQHQSIARLKQVSTGINRRLKCVRPMQRDKLIPRALCKYGVLLYRHLRSIHY